jgi:uncharacterized protein YjbI with pentapeptide repeats
VFKNLKTRISNLILSKLGESEELVRYPPFAKGIPLKSREKVLEGQKDFLERVAKQVGREQFNELYLPTILAYVDFVHLLPASENDHHRAEGGLLRHGLEVAMFSHGFATETLFSQNTTSPKDKEVLNAKWCLASFIAGIAHDLGKPITDYKVVDKSGEIVWNPFKNDIATWGKENKLDLYFLNWQKNRYRKHEALSSVVSNRFISEEVLSYLTTANNDIITQMYECISNQPSYDNQIYPIVKKADHASSEKDMREYGAKIQGGLSVPVHDYILDGFKLIESQEEWGNEFVKVPPYFLFNDSAYLTVKALKRILESLEDSQIPTLPMKAEKATSILIEQGIALYNELPDGSTRNIFKFEDFNSQDSTVVSAIKIKDWSAFSNLTLEEIDTENRFILINEDADVSPGNIEEVEQDDADVSRGNIEEVKQDDADVSSGNIEEVKQDNADVSSGNIEEVEQDDADVSSGNIEEVEQDDADVSSGNIEEVEQDDADVSSGNIEEVKQDNADVSSGNIEEVKLSEAEGVGFNLLNKMLANAKKSKCELNAKGELDIQMAAFKKDVLEQFKAEGGMKKIEPLLKQFSPGQYVETKDFDASNAHFIVKKKYAQLLGFSPKSESKQKNAPKTAKIACEEPKVVLENKENISSTKKVSRFCVAIETRKLFQKWEQGALSDSAFLDALDKSKKMDLFSMKQIKQIMGQE